MALTGRLVLSSLNWLHRWYSPTGKLTPVEIVGTYADILLGGIMLHPSDGGMGKAQAASQEIAS